MQDTDFLPTLFADKPDHLHVLVWALGNKKSAWFTDVSAATTYATGRQNLFVGVGLSPEDYGVKDRCKSEQVAGIAGLWADVDYTDGAAHKGTALPANSDEALEFVNSGLELKPSLVVHSGHGIQAWWLFPELWLFGGSAERQQAQNLSALWQRFIQARGKARGWNLDSTHDLARILRIPGTKNVKPGCESVPVALLQNTQCRWLVDDFASACELTPEAVVADPSRTRAWKQALVGSPEGSRNQDLTSLAGLLVSGLIDLESEPHLTAALGALQNANLMAAAPLDVGEVRTIFYSILKREKLSRATKTAEREFLATTPGAVDAAPAEEKLRLVGEKLGNLPLIKLVKRGREESECSIALMCGREILITDIHNQASVRKAIANATSPDQTVMLPRYKAAEWDWLVKVVLSLAVEQHAPELERRHRIEEMLNEFLADRKIIPEEQMGSAIATGSPFERDGHLYVNVPVLEQWVRSQGAKTESIGKGLYQCGFGPSEVVSAVDADKSGSKRTVQKRYRKRPI